MTQIYINLAVTNKDAIYRVRVTLILHWFTSQSSWETLQTCGGIKARIW